MLPAPELEFDGHEDYEAGGQTWTRHRLIVANWAAFSNDLFVASPDLPPCGANPSSARAWVDVLDAKTGASLYGFCALTENTQLKDLWFATQRCHASPESVYITIRDRRDNVLVASNVVSTLIPKPLLTLRGRIERDVNGKTIVEHQLAISNHAAFPDSLFLPAPDLPPSGKNPNASRTWVEILDSETHKHIYGFTALTTAADLAELWFATERCKTIPRSVYVVLEDRRCNVKYTSNTVHTLIPPPKIAAAGVQVGTDAAGHVVKRYRLVVLNRAEFPDYLFAAASDLPPCGLNPNASRTWVQIYDADTNKVIYGFAGFTASEDLALPWFGVKDGETPPARVYLVLHDRRCNVEYKSNVVEV